MMDKATVYIGVDLASSRRNITYAALNGERELLALSRGQREEVLAFIGGQSAAIVAVNAPSGLNKGITRQSQTQQHLLPMAQGGRWTNVRQAEYLLHTAGVAITRTPSELKDCPLWMQKGFPFYHHLQAMGYKPNPTDDAPQQWLEAQPEACYWALLGRAPFEHGTIEGRIQRQLVLFREDLPVPDPMAFFEEVTAFRLLHGVLPDQNIYTASELNSLVLAYTAWLVDHHPQEIRRTGDPSEGQIVLPCWPEGIPQPA
jgi:hypothetical protein